MTAFRKTLLFLWPAVMQASCAADPGMPAAVTTQLDSIVAECVAAGGKALTSNAVVRADLNADGLQDYVVYTGAINCEGAPSIYGDREKDVSVFIGDSTGSAENAFGDAAFGIRIEGEGVAARLWLTVAGPGCGKAAAPDFASEKFCDRALLWNAETRMLDYAPVSEVRML
jgi:hypothetical protein